MLHDAMREDGHGLGARERPCRRHDNSHLGRPRSTGLSAGALAVCSRPARNAASLAASLAAPLAVTHASFSTTLAAAALASTLAATTLTPTALVPATLATVALATSIPTAVLANPDATAQCVLPAHVHARLSR